MKKYLIGALVLVCLLLIAPVVSYGANITCLGGAVPVNDNCVKGGRAYHVADTNFNNQISLTELNNYTRDYYRTGIFDLTHLTRVIQFFNSKGYHLDPNNTEDGFAPGKIVEVPTITDVKISDLGSSWVNRTAKTISWNSSAIPVTRTGLKYRVGLYTDLNGGMWGNSVYVSSVVNTAQLTASIGSAYFNKPYYVRVRLVNANGTDYRVGGRRVEAKSNQTFTVVGANSQPMINIISPNGGENYGLGAIIPIKFSTTVTDKQTSGIGLQLYKKTNDNFGKMYYRDIVQNWMGGSPYNWSTPSDLPAGQYYIYAHVQGLTGVPVKELTDFSDNYFTYGNFTPPCIVEGGNLGAPADNSVCCAGLVRQITPAGQAGVYGTCVKPVNPSIAVISPNGGESIPTTSGLKGLPFSWKWSGANPPEAPTAYIIGSNGQVLYGSMLSYDAGYNPNQSVHSGALPSSVCSVFSNGCVAGLNIGGQYKIKVCEFPVGTNNPLYQGRTPMCDESDSFFTIANGNADGTNGSLSVSLSPYAPTSQTLKRGDNDKNVIAVSLVAADGRMLVNRLDVHFTERPWLNFSQVTLKDYTGTVIATKTLSGPSDVIEVTPGSNYFVRFDNVNYIVTPGTNAILFASVNVRSVSSYMNGQTVGVSIPDSSIRAINGKGYTSLSGLGSATAVGGANVNSLLMFGSPVTGAEINTRLSASSPVARNVSVSPIAITPDVVLGVYSLKSNSRDSQITKVSFKINGSIDSFQNFRLVDGAVVYSPKAIADNNMAFNPTNIQLTRDVWRDLVLKADVRAGVPSPAVSATMLGNKILGVDVDYNAVNIANAGDVTASTVNLVSSATTARTNQLNQLANSIEALQKILDSLR